MSNEDMEERLKLLEDKAALLSLMNSYRSSSDRGDTDAWADCWTGDAILELPSEPVRLVGKANIRERALQNKTRFKARQHVLSNLEFTVHGDTAAGTGTLVFIGLPDPRLPEKNIQFGGHYEWDYLRTNNTWKIKRMRLSIIWSGSQLPSIA